jgi:hypothetical protein
MADVLQRQDAGVVVTGPSSPRRAACPDHQRTSSACWKCVIHRETSSHVGHILDNDLTQARRMVLAAHQVTEDAGYAVSTFSARLMMQHALEDGHQQAVLDIAQEMYEDGEIDSPTSATSSEDTDVAMSDVVRNEGSDALN